MLKRGERENLVAQSSEGNGKAEDLKYTIRLDFPSPVSSSYSRLSIVDAH